VTVITKFVVCDDESLSAKVQSSVQHEWVVAGPVIHRQTVTVCYNQSTGLAHVLSLRLLSLSGTHCLAAFVSVNL